MSRSAAFPAVGAAVLLIAAGCQHVQRPSPDAVFRPLRERPAPAPAPVWTGPLTVEVAVRRAAEFSPVVLDLRAAADAARHAVRAAGDLRDPEIRGGFGRADTDGREETFGAQTNRTFLPGDYYARVEPPPLAGEEDDIEEQTVRREGPTISSNRTSRTSTDDDRYQSVALRVFPPNPWARGAAVSGARSALHAAEADWLDAQRVAELEMRALFAEGRRAAHEGVALDRLLATRREVLGIAREGFQAGRYMQQDLLQFSRQYLDTLSERDQQRRTLERVRRQIAGAAHVPAAGLNIDFESCAPVVLSAAFSVESLQELALRHRADLAALHWRAQELRSAWRETVAARLPWFSFIQGSYGWADEETSDTLLGSESGSTPFGVSETLHPGWSYDYRERRTGAESRRSFGSSDTEEWRIDAGITLPVFSWLGGAVRAAKAEYERAARAAETARAQLREDIEAAVGEVRAVDRIRAEYSAEANPVLAQMRAGLVLGGNAGDVTPEECLRMEQQVLDAERLLDRYEYEYAAALLNLQAKVGVLPVPPAAHFR